MNTYRFNILGEDALNLSNITERSLGKMTEDELESLANRLEEHTDKWIDWLRGQIHKVLVLCEIDLTECVHFNIIFKLLLII